MESSRSSGLSESLLLRCLDDFLYSTHSSSKSIFGIVVITSSSFSSHCSCWTSGPGWLTGWIAAGHLHRWLQLFLCSVILLVLRLVPVAVLWFALPAVGYALLLPAVGLALLPAVGFALLGSSHHRSRSSCSFRCPRTRVAVLRSSYHWLCGCGSVSDPLQRHFVVGFIFLVASPAPPTPLLSIAPFVIVGSRLVLGPLGRVGYNNLFCCL